MTKLRGSVFVTVVAMATATLLLAGCGGSGGTGFADALKHIPDNQETRQRVAYGNLADIRAATNNKPFSDPYHMIAGWGAGPLLRDWVPIGKRKPPLAIDAMKADQLIVAGRTNSEAVGLLIGGIDTAAVEKRLGEVGATKSDDGQWSLGDKGEKGWPGQMPELSVKEGEIIYTAKKADLEAALEQDKTLADSEPHKAIAGCLGDVTAALVELQSDTMKKLGVTAIGAGTSAADPKNVTETMCIVTTTHEDAIRIAGNGRKLMASMKNVTDLSAEATGSLVKLTAKPAGKDDSSKQAGQFIAMMGQFTFGALFAP